MSIAAVCWLVTLAAVVDAVRRSSSQWVEADRNKSFWITIIVLTNVIGSTIYAAFVLPRFARASSGSSTNQAFLKQP
jgi:hypothetical protein